LLAALVFVLEAPRSPFYRPKGPRSRWKSFWKAIFAFCRAVHHRTGLVACPVCDLLPKWAQLTVGAMVVLAHRTLFGAHRTVRCTNYPLAQATRRPLIALPTVGAVNRWITRQSGAPPDSLVNYSRTPPNFPESGLFTGVQPGALDTIRCTTGQSGVPD
jgi:hypothetical protein